MENESIKKSAKKDEDVIENIASFVYMNSTDKISYDDVYAQIEEAYALLKQDLKKEMEFIVSAMLEANIDPGLISDMEKEVYSGSRKDFFDQVLYSGVEDIDKIRGSVQETTLKPFGLMFDENGEIKKNVKYRDADKIVEAYFFKDDYNKDSNKNQNEEDKSLLENFAVVSSIYDKYKQSSYIIDTKVMKEIDENDKRTQDFFKNNNIDYDAVIKAANNNDLESAMKVQAWQKGLVLLNDTRPYEVLPEIEKLNLYKTLRYYSLLGDEDSKKIQEEIIKRRLPPKIQKDIYIKDENGNDVINEAFLRDRITRVEGGVLSDEYLMSELEFEAKCYMEMPGCHFEDAGAAFEDANIESKKLKLAKFMHDAYQSASFIIDGSTDEDGKKYSIYETQMKYMDLKIKEFEEMAKENPDAALAYAREALDFETLPDSTKVDPVYRKYMLGVAKVTLDVLDAAKRGEISLVEDEYTFDTKTQIFSNLAKSMIDVNEVDKNMLRKMIMLDREAANRAAQELGINTLLDVKENPDKPNLAKQAREEASKPLTEEQKQERIGRRNALAAKLIEERVRDSYLRNKFNEHQTEMLEYYNSLEIEEDKIVAADFIINGYFQQGYKCRDSETKDVRKKLFTEILKHGKLTKQQMEILVKADRDTILELIPEFSEHNPDISMQLGAALKSCKIREERSAPYIEILKENQNWNNQQKKYIAEKYFTDDKEFMEMCQHNKLVFEGESLKYDFQIKNDYDKLSTFFKEEKASYPIINMFNLKQDEDRDDR